MRDAWLRDPVIGRRPWCFAAAKSHLFVAVLCPSSFLIVLSITDDLLTTGQFRITCFSVFILVFWRLQFWRRTDSVDSSVRHVGGVGLRVCKLRLLQDISPSEKTVDEFFILEVQLSFSIKRYQPISATVFRGIASTSLATRPTPCNASFVLALTDGAAV